MSEHQNICDLLVIGSGPSGMSAAINGASEGLRVCMIDGAQTLGGQARESHAIENYPGFPDGITGNDLMTRFISQATKFDTKIHCPVIASSIRREDGLLVVTADDYSEYRAKAVILALGLSYRKLTADNIGQFMGNGVYYGLPSASMIAKKKCSIVVVGGANSAGQAVLKLAENKQAHIVMLIRRKIVDQMSKYLIDRIREIPNVDVREGVQVTDCRGASVLSHVSLSDGTEVCSDRMFIFIGAVPKTQWLQGTIEMDDKKFIRTWTDIEDEGIEANRLPFETSMRGVFAAGDVRMGSVKRVATAIGEGATALQMAHQRIAEANNSGEQ